MDKLATVPFDEEICPPQACKVGCHHHVPSLTYVTDVQHEDHFSAHFVEKAL